MFKRGDKNILTILYNIKSHLDDEYDNCIVVVGDTGSGKSHFVLQLIDTWYKAILNKEINNNTSKQLTGDYYSWVENFKCLKSFDINALDEGNLALDSKDFMTKTSKDITKLFNVFRSKKFFSIIILPDFFSLSKYFRENRLRGLFYIPSRGEYKFYSKEKIKWINALNYGNKVKRIEVVRSTHSHKFDAYKGKMLKHYEEQKDEVINSLLRDIHSRMLEEKNKSKIKETNITFKQYIQPMAFEMLDNGMSDKIIKQKLEIDNVNYTKIKREYIMQKNTLKTKVKQKLEIDNNLKYS